MLIRKQLSLLLVVGTAMLIGFTIVMMIVMAMDRRARPTIVISIMATPANIQVEAAGAVSQPGVYALPRQSRIVDLLRLAGVRPDTSLDAINQAQVLSDGQRVFFPAKPEPESEPDEDATGSLLNINTATAEELDERLPGIGPTKAQAIIDYRNVHGPFGSVDELLFVDGIFESDLAEFRHLVVVEP